MTVFLSWYWINVRHGFFINVNTWNFCFLLCSCDNKKLFYVFARKYKILYGILLDWLWVWIVFFRVVVNKNWLIRIRLLLHRILILIIIFFYHSKNLCFPWVFQLIFGILLVSHLFLLIWNSVTSSFQYLKNSFKDFEGLPFGIRLVLFELVFHWGGLLVKW